MNKEFQSLISLWKSFKVKSDELIDGIRIDVGKGEFTEILLLLKRSIDEAVDSQSILLQNGKFVGLDSLSRKVLESYIQLKYLVKNGEALKHYALFERLNKIKHQSSILELNREICASGEDPLLSKTEEDNLIAEIENKENVIKIFSELGVTIRIVPTKKARKEKPASSWYENYANLKNLSELANAVTESRMYKGFYSLWSASHHGQSVSMDYSLKFENGIIYIKNDEQFEYDGMKLFLLSSMASILGFGLLILKFFPTEFKKWRKEILDLVTDSYLSQAINENYSKIEKYIAE